MVRFPVKLYIYNKVTINIKLLNAPRGFGRVAWCTNLILKHITLHFGVCNSDLKQFLLY